MIELAGYQIAELHLLVAGLLLLFVILFMLFMGMRSAARSARMTEPLVHQLGNLGVRVQQLSDGQQQLAGGLTHVSEAQAAAQANMLQLMEKALRWGGMCGESPHDLATAAAGLGQLRTPALHGLMLGAQLCLHLGQRGPDSSS